MLFIYAISLLLSSKWATPQNGNGPNYVFLRTGEERRGMSANYVMLAINTRKVHLGSLQMNVLLPHHQLSVYIMVSSDEISSAV